MCIRCASGVYQVSIGCVVRPAVVSYQSDKRIRTQVPTHRLSPARGPPSCVQSFARLQNRAISHPGLEPGVVRGPGLVGARSSSTADAVAAARGTSRALTSRPTSPPSPPPTLAELFFPASLKANATPKFWSGDNPVAVTAGAPL